MERNVTISNITHEDLVNLFSTATYGSSWLCICKKDNVSDLEKEDDCREDVWAKALLNGRSIEVRDYYAEGSTYGDLPHHVDNDDCECGVYTLTLKDVIKGLEKCASHKEEWVRKCFNDLCDEDSVDLDLPEAECLMQVIVFGEEIYG